MLPRLPYLLPVLALFSSSLAAPQAITNPTESALADSSVVATPTLASNAPIETGPASTSSVGTGRADPSGSATTVDQSPIQPTTTMSAVAVSSVTSAVSGSPATSSAMMSSSSMSSSSGAIYITVTETKTVYSSSYPEPTAFSPPFYPAPETRGEGAWEEATEKARNRISTWTLEQKVNITTGVGWQGGRCVGNIAAQPELGWGGLCLEDSPTAIRFADFVSVFPAGINVASTFDRDLMQKRGLALGQEGKGKGVNVILGPDTNLARIPNAGRNWEGFGPDPYLAGESVYYTVKGMQTKGEGVQACVKHYIGNEQERNRTESSSNIDDRAMHELYLHPFLRAVQADVASVMCSYNLINNSWACQNSKTQNDLLKTELGFQGYIMSDWAATESGVGSVLAGLDMTMPGDITFNSNTSYFGQNLTTAVQNGSVPESRVDDMATRILAAFYLLEQDDEDFPAVNFDFRDANDPETNEHVDVQADHYKLIRQIGAASTVLLKNENKTLPLTHDLRRIAVIGNDAGPAQKGPNGFADRGGLDGILAIGWGSGTGDFPYLVSPLEAIQAKARENGSNTLVNWHLDNFDLDGVASAAAYKDAALVFISADSGEEYINVDGNIGDRNNLTAWLNGDEVVLAAASVNPNTIVVVHAVGQIDMERWVEHPNVTAIVWAGLPGQEAGNSLVDVLWGAYNPSAKLPFTIAKKIEDYPARLVFVDSAIPPVPQVDYTEGLNIDYRHFLSEGIEPRFPFGFGLSYTTFSYAGLKLNVLPTRRSDKRNQLVGVPVGTSVAPELHAPRWSVEFQLTNSGGSFGCDVPLLFIGFPESAGEPPKVLRGFERISLAPGATETVTFPLSRYDLSIWDVITQSWIIPEGEFDFYVGQSSFDEQLHTSYNPTK